MGDSSLVQAAAMGRSSAAPGAPMLRPKFILTGFGEFCGVRNNPTQQLMHHMQQLRPAGLHTAAGAAPASSSAPAVGGRDVVAHTTPPPPQQQQHAGAHASPLDVEEPYSIQSITVLEVSAAAVEAFMQKQQQLLTQQAVASSGAEGPQPVVLLHLGVDTQRPAISLELQAYNNANFSCPDQAGWKPRAHLIEAAPGLGISSVRTTTLPLQELAQQLRDAGFECGVSRDAGRFVCNYTYYKSLQLTSKLQQQLAWHQHQQQQLAGQGNTSITSNTSGGSGDSGSAGRPAHADASWPCFSLFVHVPSFDVVNQERQRQFLLHLLDLVAKWVAGSGSTSHGDSHPVPAV